MEHEGGMQMTNTATLKPCPFCEVYGALICKQDERMVVDHNGPRDFKVHCLACGAIGPNSSSKMMAIQKWNTRAACK